MHVCATEFQIQSKKKAFTKPMLNLALEGLQTRHYIFLNKNRTLRYAMLSGMNTPGGAEVRSADVQTQIEAGRVICDLDYVVQGDELRLQPFVQILGSAVTSVDETVALSAFTMYFLDGPDQTGSAADAAFDARFNENIRKGFGPASTRRQIGYSGVPALIGDQHVTVAPTGGDLPRRLTAPSPKQSLPFAVPSGLQMFSAIAKVPR